MASSIQSSLEAAVAASGVQLSDTPDFLNTQQEPQPPQEPTQEPAPIVEQQQPVAEPTESSLDTSAPDVDLDSLVLGYINEKMGLGVNAWDEF